MFGHSFGNISYQKPRTIQNVVVEVYCSLNELYSGCYKEVEYEKVVLNLDRITTKIIRDKQ